jgi:hypothetical protein
MASREAPASPHHLSIGERGSVATNTIRADALPPLSVPQFRTRRRTCVSQDVDREGRRTGARESVPRGSRRDAVSPRCGRCRTQLSMIELGGPTTRLRTRPRYRPRASCPKVSGVGRTPGRAQVDTKPNAKPCLYLRTRRSRANRMGMSSARYRALAAEILARSETPQEEWLSLEEGMPDPKDD